MSDLLDFLRERVDEDGLRLWCGRDVHDHDASPDNPRCCDDAAQCDWREKREWRAKVAILAAHPSRRIDAYDADGIEHGGYFCETCDDEMPCPTLLALAPIYCSHVDYRREWRPE